MPIDTISDSTPANPDNAPTIASQQILTPDLPAPKGTSISTSGTFVNFSPKDETYNEAINDVLGVINNKIESLFNKMKSAAAQPQIDNYRRSLTDHQATAADIGNLRKK
jgi:hypothetical protein